MLRTKSVLVSNVGFLDAGLAVAISVSDAVDTVAGSCDDTTVVSASAPPVGVDGLSNSVTVPRASAGGADAVGLYSGFPGSIAIGNAVSGAAGASSDTSGVPAAKSSPVAGDAGASADGASRGGRSGADEDRVHVGVSVSIGVSDVVTASGVLGGDNACKPSAISTVVTHDALSNPVLDDSVPVSRKWFDLARVEGLFVTIVVLYHVPVVSKNLGYAARVPAATATEVALYSLADGVSPVGNGSEPGGNNVPLNITVGEAKSVHALSAGLSPRVDNNGWVEANGESRTLECGPAVLGKAWSVGGYPGAWVGPSPAAGAGSVGDCAPPDTSPGSWGVDASAVPWGGWAESVPLDDGAGAVSSARGHADPPVVHVPLAHKQWPQELRVKGHSPEAALPTGGTAAVSLTGVHAASAWAGASSASSASAGSVTDAVHRVVLVHAAGRSTGPVWAVSVASRPLATASHDDRVTVVSSTSG